MRPTRLSLFQNTKILISRSGSPTGFSFPSSRFTNITNRNSPADLFTLSNSASRLAPQPRPTTVNYGQLRPTLVYTVPPCQTYFSRAVEPPDSGQSPPPLPVCHKRLPSRRLQHGPSWRWKVRSSSSAPDCHHCCRHPLDFPCPAHDHTL